MPDGSDVGSKGFLGGEASYGSIAGQSWFLLCKWLASRVRLSSLIGTGDLQWGHLWRVPKPQFGGQGSDGIREGSRCQVPVMPLSHPGIGVP
jgi:hypothetical protein